MTRVDVARLRELYAAATPGEWYVAPCSNGGTLLHLGGEDTAWRHQVVQVVPGDNAELIAALKNAWPAIARELEAGRRLREALVNVRVHTGRLPGASPELLNGLLDSIARIVDAVLAEHDRAVAATEEVQRD